MLADELDYVLGVDTHRDEHVMAVVTAPAGAVVAGAAGDPARSSGSGLSASPCDSRLMVRKSSAGWGGRVD